MASFSPSLRDKWKRWHIWRRRRWVHAAVNTGRGYDFLPKGADFLQGSEVRRMEKKGVKVAAQNRKARHDYFVEDAYEAGIELAGTEVKSVRAGTLNLKDAYCTVKGGELFVLGMHISPYEKGNIFNKDPERPRRLLMHKREIRKLQALVKQDGYTLVPLSVYFKESRVKVEVGLCRGKKNYDKRAASAQRDAKREMDRAMKSR